jgi:hypothetical protein
MRSIIPYTFDRRHGLAFKLTCVCSSAEAHFIHTLICSSAIERTLVQSSALDSDPSRDLFLGHFPLFPFHFSTAPYTPFPISVFFSSIHHQIHHPNTPPHHHAVTAPPPITTAGCPITPITRISPFLPHFLHFQPPPNSTFFCPLFGPFTGTNTSQIVSLLLLCCYFFIVFAGVWGSFQRGSQTLVLRLAHQVLVKIPQRVAACLEGKVQLLGPLGSKSWWPGPLLRVRSSFWRPHLLSKRTSPRMMLQDGRFKN